MDTYASVLWHLREEIQLSILVEDLTSSNKLRPEVWLVLPSCNSSSSVSLCFSLCLFLCLCLSLCLCFSLCLSVPVSLSVSLSLSLSVCLSVCLPVCLSLSVFLSLSLFSQSLCAMAALMNLYKDHGSAVRFLQRAVQVAPHSPYPHALLGLECTLMKDHDKAMAAFQTAVNIDPRHYKAWLVLARRRLCSGVYSSSVFLRYGMGFLYLQQENLDMAEVCARRALSINGSSSITCTQLAKVYQAQEKLDQALVTIERAISINSSNHLPKLQRAQILDAMGRHQEALDQLQKIAVSQPVEPLVHKLMSKVQTECECSFAGVSGESRMLHEYCPVCQSL